MEIIKLDGEDKRLYYLVAHLVMDEEVLAYNLNYPFRTSPKYLWFVAVENGETLGFVPVKLQDNEATINNYYVADDDSKVFAALLKEVARTLSADYLIESVTQIKHVPFFEKRGFSVAFHWKRFAKMYLFRREKGDSPEAGEAPPKKRKADTEDSRTGAKP